MKCCGVVRKEGLTPGIINDDSMQDALIKRPDVETGFGGSVPIRSFRDKTNLTTIDVNVTVGGVNHPNC